MTSVNSRGAMLMTLAMASFTCNDALTKFVVSDVTIGQLMAIRGVMTMALALLLARVMGTTIVSKALLHPLVLLRTACEIAATVAFLLAVSSLEFATVTALMQSLPLSLTLCAAVFLEEKVDLQRWLAILAGLCGVVLILKPHEQGFSAAACYALLSIAAITCRDLLTRRINLKISTLSLSFNTCLANTLVGSALIMPMGGWHTVEPWVYAYLAMAAVLVLCGYQAAVAAMRQGDVSFTTQFRYTGLVWGIVLGILLFGESPQPTTYIGSAIILLAGLFSFYREMRSEASLKRQRPA